MYLSCPIFFSEIFRTSTVVVRFSDKYGTCPTIFSLDKKPDFWCEIKVQTYQHTANLEQGIQFSGITTLLQKLWVKHWILVRKKSYFLTKCDPFGQNRTTTVHVRSYFFSEKNRTTTVLVRKSDNLGSDN